MNLFLAWKSFKALRLLERMVFVHLLGIIRDCTKPQLGIMVVFWIHNYGFERINYPILIYDHNFWNKSNIQLWYIITFIKKPNTQFWYITMILNSSLIGPSPIFLKHWALTQNRSTFVLPFGWPFIYQHLSEHIQHLGNHLRNWSEQPKNNKKCFQGKFHPFCL